MRAALLAVLFSASLLMGVACAPGNAGRSAVALDVTLPEAVVAASAAPSAAPSAANVPEGGEPAAPTRVCRCDVLGFESDGPPKGKCTWRSNSDGSAEWTGETSTPKFSARLTPTPSARGARTVDYVFVGEFDFMCSGAWCGPQTLSVLQVGELDYRVTVERSDEGPPSRVLWVTCAAP